MIVFRLVDPSGGLFWAKMLYVSATLIASTFVYFTYFFPYKEKLNLSLRASIIFGINIFLVFLIASGSNIIINVTTPSLGEKNIFFAPLYIIYFLYILIFFFFGYYRLYRKYLVSDDLEKKQILYLGLGYVIAGNVAFVTNLSLPWFGYFKLNWLGQIFTFFIVAFSAYAIILHRLLDIKLVMRKYSVYIASLVTVLGLAVGMQFLLKQISPLTWIIDIITIAASVALFPPIRSYYYHFANKYFFSSLYDAREVIADMSESLRGTLEVDSLLNYISTSLQGAFHAKGIAILLQVDSSTDFRLAYNEGVQFAHKKNLHLGEKACAFLLEKDKPFSNTEADTRSSGKVFMELLTHHEISLVAPLNVKNKCVGIILLREKESGDLYNDEDLNVLNVVGSQAAIAFENALLYAEAQQFNEVLAAKVEHATRKLRTQNKKLKELDHLKTEFISVASHQLRTPLTATRWALESLRNGQEGVLKKKQKETVKELTGVNQKLIVLVNELLNVSRIDEGRLKIEPKPLDLGKVVRTTLHEYMPIADQKGLKVIIRVAKIPLIKLDENVISKAISNILSNGIKYNRNGKHLWVKVYSQGKEVIIEVRDEGIGIPKSEQDRLFQKFYRASNAASSNTEGSGLGLYIAKTAIEKSGGRMWFKSQEGVGTTFSVAVPKSGSHAVRGEKSLA